MDKIKIFEWVKDGNLGALQAYMKEREAHGIKFDCHILDHSKKNILHWSCFLGQLKMATWILENFKMNLAEKEEEGYNALDLAIIRGQQNFHFKILHRYSQVLHQRNQLLTVKLLVNAGAKFHHSADGKNNSLHWAFYNGNKFLIYYILENDYKLIYKLNEFGLYPIDYLFYDKKPKAYRQDTNEIFEYVVSKYIVLSRALKNKKKSPVVFYTNRMTSEPWIVDEEPPLEYIATKYNRRNQDSVLVKSKVSEKFIQFDSKNIYESNIQTPQIGQSEMINLYNINTSQMRQNVVVDEEPEAEKESNKKFNTESKQHQPKKFILERKKQAKEFTIHRNFTAFHHDHVELFEARLLFWSSYMNNVKFCIQFMEHKCSPFQITFNGQNSIHAACSLGNFEVIELFLTSIYSYDHNPHHIPHKGGNFDKEHSLNTLSKISPSTPLHLAIESENFRCVKLLISQGASIDIVNYRTLKPFEISYNHKILKFYVEHFPQESPSFVDRGFVYVLQTKGKAELNDDIVFIQLMNIKEKLKEDGIDFGFTVLHRPEICRDDDSNEPYRPPFYFYVIQVTHETIYQLADRFNLQCFHFKKKIICEFVYAEHNNFEFPTDLQVQQLLINTLNEEFDVETFLLEGLLTFHFPMENLHKLKQIEQFWKEEELNCLKDTIRQETIQSSLKPLNSLTLYFGPVIGYYFAFLVQLIGWLIFPSIVGLGFGAIQIVTGSYDNKYVPLYAVFMALWATIFMESWKRRESELTFLWDMYKFKQVEPVRVMYSGPFTYSSITNKIEEFDPFTSFKRRAIADGPIIAFGVICVITSFVTFNLLLASDTVKQNPILKVIIGSLNGVVMTLLSTFYKTVVHRQVNWENHRLESEMLQSYITKLFFFEFINSYIMLIYQAVVLQDPRELGVSVGSITVTRGLIGNVTINGVPYLMNKFIQKYIYHTFDNIKAKIFPQQLLQDQQEVKINNGNSYDKLDNNISPQKNEIDKHLKDPTIIADQTWATEKLTKEEQFELLRNVESCILKLPQKLLIDEYTSIVIQFGYITMFATAFPAAPIIFMINMYINLKFSLNNYCNVTKRERAMAADSIGVWLNIFSIMNYAATFMNCLVIGTTNVGQLNNLIGLGNPIRNVFILIATEHIIIFIKFIVALVIDDCPDWVKYEMKKIEYVEHQQKHA